MFNSDTKWWLKISGLVNSPKKIRIVFIIAIAAVLLLFFSELDFSNDKQNEELSYGIDINEYKKDLESELTKHLKNMSGVGKVKVMITLESNQEISYVNETEKDGSQGESDISYSEKNNYVIIDDGDKDRGLVKKITEPRIRGVLVICDGGDDITVKTKVTEAVKKLFSISSASICVTN